MQDPLAEKLLSGDVREEIAEEFRGAVDRNEISVVYQPMVSLRSGRVRELEALARWENRRFGWVPVW